MLFSSDLADATRDFRGIELGDQRHVCFGDAGFLRGDVRQSMAEELLMIEREIGDRGYEWPLDHVRRVEPSAEPHFEDAGVGRRSGESEQRNRCRDLEEAGFDSSAR